MKRFILLCTAFFCIHTLYAVDSGGRVKVSSRMSYFFPSDGNAGIIVTCGNNGVSMLLGKKKVELELALEQETNGGVVCIYEFPVSVLNEGENKAKVLFGKEKFEVTLTLLPEKDNSVRIDYFTGLLHTRGLPFLPCGFYCYSPVQPTLADEEAARGMNLMSPYQNILPETRWERIEYLDRCARLGMRVNYNLLTVAGGGGGAKAASPDMEERWQMLREEIRALKDHPAILSWYVADEPEGQGVSVETMEKVYGIVMEEDPYHPVSLVIMSSHAALEYAHTCDIVMMDHYPVPQTSADEVVDYMHEMHEALRYEKALWYVPQTFGGGDWMMREPTAAEIRMMTWGAALEGARGFQGFIRHGLNGFPKNTYMWETYTRTCREIRELTPFFDRGVSMIPDTYSKGDIVVREYILENQSVVVAVNRKAETVEYNIGLNRSWSGTAYNISDMGRKRVVEGLITGVLSPFGVEVLRIYRDLDEERAFLGDNTIMCPGNILQDPGFEWEYSISGSVPAAAYAKVGENRGATYFLDPQVAYHGTHSLRMINPSPDKGTKIQFYPPAFRSGKTYIMSVWAKGQPSPLKGKNEIPGFRMNMGGVASREFELSDRWERYEIIAEYTGSRARWAVDCSLEMLGEGCAWFDLVTVVPDMEIKVGEYDIDKKAFPVSIEHYIEGGRIFYTFDGSDPAADSYEYDPALPFWVDDVRTLKARVMGPDGVFYGMSEQQIAAHKAIGAEVTYLQPYKKYDGGGESALVDGRVAYVNPDTRYNDEAWQGFDQNDLEVIIKLKEPVLISRITAQFYQSRPDWIMPPLSVEYQISADGINYESLGIIELGEAKDVPTQKIPVSRDNINREAVYIKVHAVTHGQMPSWHPKGDAWMFVDEVIVE